MPAKKSAPRMKNISKIAVATTNNRDADASHSDQGKSPGSTRSNSVPLPSPGSSAFNELPPVGIAFKNIKTVGRKLSFGSVDAKESAPTEKPIKRSRAPSAKKLYMTADADQRKSLVDLLDALSDEDMKRESAAAKRSPSKRTSPQKTKKVKEDVIEISSTDEKPAKKAATKASKMIVKKEVVTDSDEEPAKQDARSSEVAFIDDRSEDQLSAQEDSLSTIDSDISKYESAQRAKQRQRKKVIQKRRMSDQSDDGPKTKLRRHSDFLESSRHEESDVPQTPITKKGKGRQQFTGNSESEVEVSKEMPRYSSKYVKSKAEALPVILKKTKDKHLHSAEENESDNIASSHQHQSVMQVSKQDPLLVADYKSLPHLKFGELVPFPGSSSSSDDSMLRLSNILEAIDKKLEGIILAGLRFAQNSIYFNPARINPNVLSYKMERIVIPGNQTYPPNALLMMLGAVAECSIVNPAIGGTNIKPSRVKRIGLFPFSQEYERTMACLCNVVGIQYMLGNICDGVISFTSRKESANGKGWKINVSPKKAQFFGPSSSSPQTTPNFNSRTCYPSSLAFDDEVPIYDGRNAQTFDFGSSDFSRIKQLPLWKGGSRDIPEYSMVSVGYTASTYLYSINGVPTDSVCLSTNLQFVIVHGILGN